MADVHLESDGASHPRVGGREIEQHVDGELSQHLVLKPVQFLGEQVTQPLDTAEGGSGKDKIDIGLLKCQISINAALGAAGMTPPELSSTVIYYKLFGDLILNQNFQPHL